MGWLGYTEQETLDTSIPALEIGYAALLDKLKIIHGLKPADPEPEPAEPPTGKAIMSVFRAAGSKRTL